MIDVPSAAPSGPELLWWPESGIGYFPVDQALGVYDEGYWQKYIGYDTSPMGRRLARARVELVARHYPRGLALIDVGIGAGGFILARSEGGDPTFGSDVNPTALAWLEARGLRRDPEHATFPHALSFWDCLEHIPEPGPMLAQADAVFVSLPLFEGPEHILRSKHFRRDEHCWYFTRAGLIRFFERHGFECAEHNTAETLIGREDISSFAFLRR